MVRLGRRLPGVRVSLRNTNYVVTADTGGVARFVDVFPGRYAVEVANRELEALGFVSEASLANAGRIDSAVVRPSQVWADTLAERPFRTIDVHADRTARHVAPMPSMKQFAASACRDPRSGAPRRAVLGRAVYGSGRGADSVLVKADGFGRGLRSRIGGTFVLCGPDDWTGPVKLKAEDGPMRSEEVVLELGAGVTTVRLILRP